jgi:rhodanese-related sulfurtransferase
VLQHRTGSVLKYIPACPPFQRNKTVLVYCGSGVRAVLAGKTLKDFGYTDVRNLGGFQDWVAAGDAVEKI